MPEPQIFLSYAREDATDAARLCADLRAQGREVWYDRDCLRGGEKWRSVIDKAIQTSDFFVALLSSASVSKRGVVQAEIKKALETLDEMPDDRIYLIPVRVTECNPSYARLKELHWIDLFPRWEDGLAQILKSTALDIGTPDLSDTPTPLDDLVRSMPPVPPEGELTTSVRVSEAVRESIDLFQRYAVQRNVAIRFVDRSPGTMVRVVRRRLIVALANILSNAIKYSYTTPEHPFWVDISSDATPGGIQLRFENWGVGIPRDDLENGRIFNLGYRGRAASDHYPRGAGIGLAIAKAVCDEYDGSIGIQSRPVRSQSSMGAGEPHVTTVVVTLPSVEDATGT